ncbi:hypothetical protein GCM10020229_41890 [Kitasatospora albolonga]|uniref:hypothetical protein n=1 Tax=Kitasatospora albolonga TaxID=68173 RepID=UPI00337511D1
MHNAGTIAGMAFGSAFLGVVHAMAHTLGATFHVAHGRTNAILLPQVIRYTRRGPVQGDQLAQVPELRGPGAVPGDREDARLPAGSPEQGVESLARDGRGAAGQGRHPDSFKAAGSTRRPFLEALPQQAMYAYERHSAPGQNPRCRMIADMQQLNAAGYYGDRV